MARRLLLSDSFISEKQPRNYVERKRPFEELTDKKFRQTFRLSKEATRYVVDLIAADIESPTARSHALSAEEKACRFSRGKYREYTNVHVLGCRF